MGSKQPLRKNAPAIATELRMNRCFVGAMLVLGCTPGGGGDFYEACERDEDCLLSRSCIDRVCTQGCSVEGELNYFGTPLDAGVPTGSCIAASICGRAIDPRLDHQIRGCCMVVVPGLRGSNGWRDAEGLCQATP